jgi:hypothetical protein
LIQQLLSIFAPGRVTEVVVVSPPVPSALAPATVNARIINNVLIVIGLFS